MHRFVLFAVVLNCPLSELHAEERNTQGFEMPGGYEVVPAVRDGNRERPVTRHAVERLSDEKGEEPEPMYSRAWSGPQVQHPVRSGYSF